MNLTPQSMLIVLIGGLALLSSCSQDVIVPADQSDATADPQPFAQTSFDGRWSWYEDGKRTYDITIAGGKVVSFRSLNRRAASASESSATCSVDSRDGLVAISSTRRARDDRWGKVITLRFDLADAPHEACRGGLKRGAILGRRTVERNDRDDHFLFPPQSAHEGLLVRRQPD